MPPGIPPTSVPPVVPPVSPETALGRFSSAAPAPEPSPDDLAVQAFTEAQAAGGDGLMAAKEAWKQGVRSMAGRMAAPGYQPTAPGDANLQRVMQHLQQKTGTDPDAALAMAYEFIAKQASQIGQPQQGVT